MTTTTNTQTHAPLNTIPPPPLTSLTSPYLLTELIGHLSLLQESFPHVKIPLLRSHLWDVLNHNVDPETHLRGFLKVFEETDVFRQAFGELDEEMRSQIKAFIGGKREEDVLKLGVGVDFDDGKGDGSGFHWRCSPGVKRHFKEMVERLVHFGQKGHGHAGDGANGAANGVNGKVEEPLPLAEGYPRIFEDEAKTRTMEVYADKAFRNWGNSVQNKPKWTFVPRTILGLQNLVKYAKVHGLRVRCAGYRHSWSSTFSQDNEILVSLLSLKEVTTLPDPLSIEAEEVVDPGNELRVIHFANGHAGLANGGAKNQGIVRVGVSVTNEQFRRWAVANDRWTLPVDVILVEVTFGGVNGPICHGAGRRHKTINDQVRAVEYVDANGVHRTISDPAHLKAAAGCFGLLGIVTHITFALEPMRYAVLKPVKPDIGLAIPPLSREDIPLALRKSWTDAQYAAALADFENRASNDYYSEWFWFTRSQQAWVNTWNPTEDKKGVVEYPSSFLTWCQWVQGWLGAVVTGNPIFQDMPGRWQAQILATLGMVNLPPFEFSPELNQDKPTEVIKTAIPNALHFRRGIQNMRVRDLEFQIPIPGLVSDTSKPDYSIVQRAWWDIIKLCYEDEDCPMRLTMELRIMGDSDLLMAPQFGNRHGTASIEVLSVPDAVSDGEWVPFLQRVVDLWASYKDENGALLNVRPHWAKEWESIEIRGKPSREYLRTEAYKDQIPKFKAVLADIGKGQGWELDDIKSRFSNELWDYMIYS